jgi:colanic acid/amylovoran biosynthesis glycosyltransferase
MVKNKAGGTLSVMFVVGKFPAISETFIIDQAAELLDRGVDVRIFYFEKGDERFVSARYGAYRLSERAQCLSMPAPFTARLLAALPRALRLLFFHPPALVRALNFVRYGRAALSLRYLYWAAAFAGKKFDVAHCHFGTVAVSFLDIKDFLRVKTPLVTTFYGYDASAMFKEQPGFYDRLKREGSLFFVMSDDMKRRVTAQGFPEEKVKVLPVSIDVGSYPFSERKCDPGEPVEIVSVGRFVEKKGFDDILRALAVVRRRTQRAFRCSFIGGGELEGPLRRLSASLGLDDVVDFKGYMTMEDIVPFLLKRHLMVQPSKTAANGDME